MRRICIWLGSRYRNITSHECTCHSEMCYFITVFGSGAQHNGFAFGWVLFTVILRHMHAHVIPKCAISSPFLGMAHNVARAHMGALTGRGAPAPPHPNRIRPPMDTDTEIYAARYTAKSKLVRPNCSTKSRICVINMSLWDFGKRRSGFARARAPAILRVARLARVYATLRPAAARARARRPYPIESFACVLTSFLVQWIPHGFRECEVDSATRAGVVRRAAPRGATRRARSPPRPPPTHPHTRPARPQPHAALPSPRRKPCRARSSSAAATDAPTRARVRARGSARGS